MIIKIKKLFLTLGFILIIIFSFWLYRVNYFIKQKPLQITAPGYIVQIHKGASVQMIAEKLAQDKVLNHPEWFVIWVRLKEDYQKIKAGEYLIQPGMTPKDFITMLIEGKVMLHAVTIVEGWTFDRILQAIQQSPKINQTLVGLSHLEIMNKLGLSKENLEGLFFPDTYLFPLGTTDIQFLQRANRVLNQKLAEVWDSRDPNLPLKDPYEALILASIIEKESSVTEEYGEISGVYIRRLLRHMPLQADPTVVYGVRDNYQGQITKEHLSKMTPYNTYLNSGLPPTPIAIPSQKALYAATHPKPGNSLYFVAKGEGGGHVFSRSIEEHQVAVKLYRKALLSQKRDLVSISADKVATNDAKQNDDKSIDVDVDQKKSDPEEQIDGKKEISKKKLNKKGTNKKEKGKKELSNKENKKEKSKKAKGKTLKNKAEKKKLKKESKSKGADVKNNNKKAKNSKSKQNKVTKRQPKKAA